MKITPRGEQLIIAFSPNDWKYHKSGCEAIITAIKQEIPSALREYNPLNKEWTISSQYRGVIEQLRDEHLTDNNQASLF